MELHQLKSFVAVAEEENLTRAAERLFTSQPSVSAHIKALEEELGVGLFERTSRGMAITPDGEKLLRKAHEILANVGGLNELARDLQANPAGALKIGVILDGDDMKLEAIAELHYADYPGVQLEFIHGSSGMISKGILNGELDIGFAEGVVESPLLKGVKVGVTETLVVASPKHKEIFESTDWKSLEKLPWIFKTPDCSYHTLMNRISRANGITLNKRYLIDHEATCLQFVRNGNAISVVNKKAVEEQIESGELIAWKGFQERLDIQLLCQSKRFQERKIRAFYHATMKVLGLDDSNNSKD